MKAAKEDLLSVPHFACLGGIVFAFARLEYLIQVTWGQANVEHLKILVLTKSLSYSQKRDTLYSYFKNFKLENPNTKSRTRKLLIEPTFTIPFGTTLHMYFGGKERARTQSALAISMFVGAKEKLRDIRMRRRTTLYPSLRQLRMNSEELQML